MGTTEYGFKIKKQNIHRRKKQRYNKYQLELGQFEDERTEED